ncbi:nucleotide-binding protein [Candidatus Poribacteria bacterium]|nr:nucleotide-binding protein [Candidatus Poribacteria bacterium]
MIPKARVYVHAPLPRNLSPRRQEVRTKVLDAITAAGFDPQEFGVSGLPARLAWTFDEAACVMDRCQGSVIIALPKYEFGTDMLMPSEYSHYEGALALSKGVPTLIITEEGAPNAGIVFLGGGHFINRIPLNDALIEAITGKGYLDSDEFRRMFDMWANEVSARSRLFLGYCSKAQSTAAAIIKYLKTLQVDVIDWDVDFRAGATIMDEISAAIRSCRCGIFLFTRDDPLKGDTQHAPRDNVVFEAGFCIATRGPQRTIVIREEGTKMPADLGGSIYLPLKDRGDIAPIQEELRQALEKSL